MYGVPGEPTFEGELSVDETTISGKFTQGGQAIPFSIRSGIPPADAAREALEGIGEVIERALEDHMTPSISVCVVVDGEVILAEGFGLRDIDELDNIGSGISTYAGLFTLGIDFPIAY